MSDSELHIVVWYQQKIVDCGVPEKQHALSQCWLDAVPKSTTLAQHHAIIGSAYCWSTLTHSEAAWRIYKGVIRDSCTVPVYLDTGCRCVRKRGGGVQIKDKASKKHSPDAVSSLGHRCRWWANNETISHSECLGLDGQSRTGVWELITICVFWWYIPDSTRFNPFSAGAC